MCESSQSLGPGRHPGDLDCGGRQQGHPKKSSSGCALKMCVQELLRVDIWCGRKRRIKDDRNFWPGQKEWSCFLTEIGKMDRKRFVRR